MSESTPILLLGPDEMAHLLADRIKTLRLLRGWTQATLAHRAGVTTPSYRRFETTGQASVALVLKVAHALARLEDFDRLFQMPPASSIKELASQSTAVIPIRKRGVR